MMSQIENMGKLVIKPFFTIGIKSSLSPTGYCLHQQ